MIAECGCRVKSYRAKQCPHCKQWMCPACYSEHVSCLKVYCPDKQPLFKIKNLKKTQSFLALIDKYFKPKET